MRKLTLIVVTLLCFNTTYSQAQTIYYYTKASERYFSDAEMDSLVLKTVTGIFEQNYIPATLYESKYPQVKSLLIATSRTAIAQAFTLLEAQTKTSINASKGSVNYIANKKSYTEYFVQQLNKTFNSNQALKIYLSFNGSDRITSYNSIVKVQANGKLLVTENISVYNGNGRVSSVYGNDARRYDVGMNDEIQRGIVYAFPVYYSDSSHLMRNTTFSLKQVLKNGEPEDYHTEKKDNAVLVYTGSKDVILKDGFYRYTLVYETDHQLKRFENYDELFWNAVGAGWRFHIDSATCKVILPAGTKIQSSRCYTGLKGSTAEDCNYTSTEYADSTVVFFKASKPLLPMEGFSIATAWQKGIVARPNFFQAAGTLIWQNKAIFFLPIAALLSAIFCFFYWYKYGRDPEKGTVYPQYEPPPGFSPAAIGYIYQQKFDRSLTAATIVDAAVRNKIKIDVQRKGLLFKHNAYSILAPDIKSKPPITNYNDYDDEIRKLIGTSIEKGRYNATLGALNTTLQKDCDKTYKNKDGYGNTTQRGFFALNRSFRSIPILLCIGVAVWAFIDGVVPAMMIKNFWQALYFVIGIILCVVVLKVFGRLLPAYNKKGRELMDYIEGFRMFLVTADTPRLDLMNPPKKTLELYEKYLPFAIALGCEIAWGKQFENIIESASLDGTITSAAAFSYSMRNDQSFSSSFTSSFSGAISSASTPPSSSSGGGSFGGGSSGGGGGGGGGGGW